MVVFIVPLKSRHSARSWMRTCLAFERTLRSICNQTSSDFRVLVVCHDVPAVGFSHPLVEYIQVDYPPPDYDRKAGVLDRQRKEMVGVLGSRACGRCHIMRVDADDCISLRVAEFVNRNSAADGWYVDRGYLYLEGVDRVRALPRGFYRWCGSSSILLSDRIEFLRAGIDALPADATACAALYARYFARHRQVVEWMNARGVSMRPLPFRAVVYMLGHGENSDAFNPTPLFHAPNPLSRILQRTLRLRSLSPAIRAEFGVYHLPSAPGANCP